MQLKKKLMTLACLAALAASGQAVAALSDASRVRLISLLMEGEMSVSTLAEELKMTESYKYRCLL